MNRRNTVAVGLFATAALTLNASATFAHHSSSATYDRNRTVSVRGVVTEFRFVNPHSMLSLDVTDDSGKVVRWTVELAGRLNLSEAGWDEHTLQIGERIDVTGSPARVDLPRMWFTRIVKADGTELGNVGATALSEIERVRQERARQRTQQK
jgi:hypothetical protein